MTDAEWVQKLSNGVKALESLIADYQQQLKLQIYLLQTSCPHEHAQQLLDCTSRDYRVCLCCGLAEMGWGCGYQVLRDCSVHIGWCADGKRRGPMHENHKFVLNIEMRQQGITQQQLNAKVIAEGLGVTP